MADGGGNGPEVLGRLKTLGDLLRQYGLLAFFVMLFLNPTWVNTWVQEAGIRKFGDLEFTPSEVKQVEKLETELQDKRQVIDQLVTELKATKQVVVTFQANAGGSTAPAVIGPDVGKRLKRTDEAIQLAEQSKHRSRAASPGPSPWYARWRT